MSELLEEHYSYLSDGTRLRLFRDAVARAVRPGDGVADIGCGIGVLGLLCLEAGASHVWGIDRTGAIEIARETMRRAGLGDRYTCLNQDSRFARLPEPVDVLICDHVGYFGFDYGIVQILSDARRFLRPGGTVIPGRIVLKVAGARSDKCRALANAWHREPILPEFHWLREYGVNAKHAVNFERADIATAPADCGTIDLRAVASDHAAFTAALIADSDGDLDGLAGWFDCELAEGVWMTNSPLAEGRVDRNQVFLPFDRPLAVRAGDVVEVSLSLRYEEQLFGWKAKVERTGQAARQSTWGSTVLHPQDRVGDTDRVPHLSPEGEARRTLLDCIDGSASSAEIERAVLRDHADLFPSRRELARFVRSELGRNTD